MVVRCTNLINPYTFRFSDNKRHLLTFEANQHYGKPIGKTVRETLFPRIYLMISLRVRQCDGFQMYIILGNSTCSYQWERFTPLVEFIWFRSVEGGFSHTDGIRIDGVILVDPIPPNPFRPRKDAFSICHMVRNASG